MFNINQSFCGRIKKQSKWTYTKNLGRDTDS